MSEHYSTQQSGKPTREQALLARIAELELQVEQLRLQAAQPDQATKAKQDFLANMSHELRTPLNGLLGMAEVLRETGLDMEQREYVDALKQCGHDLLRIVNNLLDISSAERGRLQLRPRVFPLRSTIESALRQKRELALDKGLEFSLHLDDTLPEQLWGDAARLQQVVLNLVGNAVKFTPQGSVSVTVEPWEQRQGAGDAVSGATAFNICMLHCSVADTGIGIAEDVQEGIFEAFHLSEVLLTKKYAGAGLGLPISRHLAQAMGGELWFQSAPGVGSTFHFTAMFEVPFPDRRRAPAPLEQPAEPAPCENLDVLLVEDEEVSRFLARVMLTRMGHTVTCAENGRQALELLARKTFDLVLMDIQMPEMDGISATMAIRDPGSAVLDHGVPVVALTVFAMQGDRERFLGVGMDEYITKPVEKDRLQRVISRAISRRTGSGGGA